MDSEYIKDFIIYIIQHNYKELTEYINNLQNHANSLYSYHIISLYDRNILIGKMARESITKNYNQKFYWNELLNEYKSLEI